MSHITEHPSRAKRRKLDEPQPEQPATITSNIKNPSQLRELLAVQQNAPLAKQGINKFKEFLLSIPHAENEAVKTEKLRVLKNYCDKQISNSGKEDETSVCFPDLIASWAFADGNNNEPLLTAVPAILALFFKTVSSELEFREFGIALCKHLLQKDQLRLFNRGLTATKSKEHLISPCLRLLTEMVTFDGGAVARQLYLRRYITFKRLEVFLTPNKAQEGSEGDRSKSTLRLNAQRYLLANLRVQHASEKGDIIEQHKITRSFLEYIRKDSRESVLEIIKAIERDVVQDANLSRKSKSKFFNRHNLERLVTLYGYDRESDEPNPDGVVVANEIHRVMMNVCNTAGLGVLLPETGWYPVGTDPETLPVDDDSCIELGLDSPIYVDKYRENVPVRNGSLSFLIQCLRPDQDSLQIELLVTIFKAAPELIADFFSRKTMFISDPKASPSWMAESAFLFSTVQLPVPANCGWKDKQPILPPPVSIAIENILPRPLSQKIMTRCLNQNAEIITLFAVRILTVAFAKLRATLKVFQADHGQGQLFWNQATAKLLAEFSRRCPAVKDVVVLFRRTDKDDLTQQEAVAELLTCYYEVMPDIALEENFDVSLVLVDVLKRLEASDVNADDSESLLGQLQSILQIAQQSASLRWWQKPANMQYSPFTSILKVLMDTSDKDSSRRISTLLKTVLVENSVLRSSPLAFVSILSSLENSEPSALHQQLVFFDNCVSRVAKKPVHYLDLLQSLSTDPETVSALVAVVVEQWPFVVKAGDASTETAVGSWIASLFANLKQAGESTKALKAARDALVEATETKTIKSLLKKSLKGDEVDIEDKMDIDSGSSLPTQTKKAPVIDLDEIFGFLPTEGTTHNALHKWEREDIEEAIDQDHLAELMLCICSEHEEVRRQAFAGLIRFMAKLKESKYEEWRTVFTLCGELLETVNNIGLEKPVPWIVGECAANCLAVLTNPLHKVYGKVNKFLQKAPVWEVEKIPTYWVDKILLHEPELDDGYFDEIDWLLNLFVKALRTEADMEVYRRANVFERLLSLYQSPTIGPAARRKILHIVYRGAQVGGSTTLITRSGIISWIQIQAAEAGEKEHAQLAALAHALYDKCDRQRVDAWSNGTLGGVIDEIQMYAPSPPFTMSPPRTISHNREVREEPDHLNRLIRLIYSSHMPTFTKAELEPVGVTTGSFDIWDAAFISDSRKCLFRPFDEKELRMWMIPADIAHWESIRERLDLKEVDANSKLARSPSTGEIRKGIKDIMAYLNTNFIFRSNGPTKLCSELGCPRSVNSRNKDFLFSGHGTKVGTTFPSWQVWSIQVWRERNLAGADFQIGPSVRMIISTEAIGRCDRILLNELGAIAECIAFRRRQQDFPPYPIVPVLLLSLFGRRNGRIIQARYDVHSGKTVLLVSPLLSFWRKEDPSFEIFLRFMASCPPESCSLDQKLSRMSISSPPAGLDPEMFRGT
ncbi:unnamed protein product [Penicillium salamii]|nr:unnamed protein product [Penicillium salamii]